MKGMKIRFKEKLIKLIKPLTSIFLGLFLGLMVTRIAGEDPWNVLQILVHSAFGSKYDFGMTLFYATPLIFTGLSVSFAFHAGLFNIGAEGQLAFGALAAAAMGIWFPEIPSPWAPLLAGIAAAFAGGVWGAIPGWLRARRGSHEVINTIMLNFIAAGLTSWITLYILKDLETQNPETAMVSKSFLVQQLTYFDQAPVSTALFLALIAAVLTWFFLFKTVLGYEIRAVGQSETAARAAGINAGKVRIIAMCVAGALAGLVGVSEVLGNAERFRIGFSPGYGFIGIAVALLGRNKPSGIVAAALLFGALHKGTSDLDLETENVTRDLSLILQALVILCVSADGLWDFFGDQFKAFRKKKVQSPRGSQAS